MNPVGDNHSMIYKRHFCFMFKKVGATQTANLRSSKDDLSLTG